MLGKSLSCIRNGQLDERILLQLLNINKMYVFNIFISGQN